MIALLSRIFIKNWDNPTEPGVRLAYGVLCSVTGIVLNLLLFLLKLAAGSMSGAISITADAFNNLTDAGSSIVTLVGFRISGAKPDRDHPFGHGRFEYIAGLVVSFIILFVGIELGKSSVLKIFNPSPVNSSTPAMIIVASAIIVKLYMYYYNRSVGKKIDSPAMMATALDSLSDTVATSFVLISMLLLRLANINADGWFGAVVAVFILYTGYSAARNTISPLLGQPPKENFVRDIKRIVLSYKEIIGIHDLIVHDYGPGRVMISLHGEVSDGGDINELHDAIDRAEAELREKLGCEAVIHMDPIAVNDKTVMERLSSVMATAHSIDGSISVHDFRMVIGPTHTNLIFDVVVPQRFHMSDDEVASELQRCITAKFPDCLCVITVDKAYL